MNCTKKIQLLLLLIASIIFTVGCSDDDDSPITKNSFTFKNNEYSTSGAYALMGVDESKRCELGFYSEGLSYDIIKGDKSYNKSGNFILLIVPNSSGKLENGTYQLLEAASNGVFLDFDFSDGTGTRFNPTSGTIEISGNATNKTIKYELKISGGEVLKGTYSGPIEIKQ